MDYFYIWFSLGVQHITNWDAYDHILFLFALCCVYSTNEWRNLLLNITAFTIGHSISLVLSVINLISFNIKFIELLIPITILITSVNNVYTSKLIPQKTYTNFILTLVFGLIHGMGFSAILKQMLGNEEKIIFPLFYFNIGIEIGQLLVVLIIILISFLIVKYLKINQNTFSKLCSKIIGGIALLLIIIRVIDL